VGDGPGALRFGGSDAAVQLGVAGRVPGGPKRGAEADFHVRQCGAEPFGYRSPATVEVAGHDEVPDDQFRVAPGPHQVFAHHRQVAGNAGQAPGAAVIAEFKIRDPNIKDVIEQLARFGGTVGVGFPHKPGVSGQFGDEGEHCREVNGGFAAEKLDGGGALGERLARPGCHGLDIEWIVGLRVPARGAADAKIAAEITTAQGDGEGGQQFKFIAHFGLGGKEAGLRAGMAKAALAAQPVHAAVMSAEMAVCEASAGKNGAVAGHVRTRKQGRFENLTARSRR
jgi:hypothetical protein